MRAAQRYLCLLLCAATATASGSSPHDAEQCESRDLRRARAEAARLMGQQQFKGAAALLRPFVSECPLEDDEGFWLVRDLSLALLRAGDFVACRRAIVPFLYSGRDVSPIVEAGLEGSEVEESLERMLALCTQAQEKTRVALRADACPFSVSPKPAAIIAIPGTFLSPGATHGCLVITESPPQAHACPQLLVAEEDAAGERRTRPLKPSADLQDPLSSSTRCCNARTLRAGLLDGKRVILLGGQGRACSGDAVEELEGIYEWPEGDRLRFVRDESVMLRAPSRSPDGGPGSGL